jgi:hypothetical protein
MLRSEWIVAKGSAIGEYHIASNIPCQDAFQVFLDDETSFGIAVVSDGAGSAKNSHIGSNYVAQKSMELLRQQFNDFIFENFLTKDVTDIGKHFDAIFREVLYGLQDISTEDRIELKSLAATVIVVLFSKSGIICSHIGDGRAAYQDTEGNWYSILDPYKGEEANQTIFLTSDIWYDSENFIRTKSYKGEIKSFTLMTDGCEFATYQLNRLNPELQVYERTNIPHAPFFDPNVSVLRDLKCQGRTTDEIDNLWTQFLTAGNKKFQEERDDKTLILGTLNIEC